jgi:hypothetical protein
MENVSEPYSRTLALLQELDRLYGQSLDPKQHHQAIRKLCHGCKWLQDNTDLAIIKDILMKEDFTNRTDLLMILS